MKKELVRSWMTPDPITVKLETNLPEVHQIMVSEEIRRLPVVDDDGRLLGIVTLGDVRGLFLGVQAIDLFLVQIGSGRVVRMNDDQSPGP